MPPEGDGVVPKEEEDVIVDDQEHTPIIFDEFQRCNSVYVISDKDSESAISSDGEFMDACKINIFDEDDSHIDQIEDLKKKKALRDSIYTQGLSFKKDASSVMLKMQSLRTFHSNAPGGGSLSLHKVN